MLKLDQVEPLIFRVMSRKKKDERKRRRQDRQALECEVSLILSTKYTINYAYITRRLMSYDEARQN